MLYPSDKKDYIKPYCSIKKPNYYLRKNSIQFIC